jgi:hypothetical protein
LQQLVLETDSSHHRLSTAPLLVLLLPLLLLEQQQQQQEEGPILWQSGVRGVAAVPCRAWMDLKRRLQPVLLMGIRR